MFGGGGIELSWAAVLQAVVLAVCTWYMRRGARADKEDIKQNTSSPDDVALIWSEVRSLRVDFDQFRRDTFKTLNKG